VKLKLWTPFSEIPLELVKSGGSSKYQKKLIKFYSTTQDLSARKFAGVIVLNFIK